MIRQTGQPKLYRVLLKISSRREKLRKFKFEGPLKSALKYMYMYILNNLENVLHHFFYHMFAFTLNETIYYDTSKIRWVHTTSLSALEVHFSSRVLGNHLKRT